MKREYKGWQIEVSSYPSGPRPIGSSTPGKSQMSRGITLARLGSSGMA